MKMTSLAVWRMVVWRVGLECKWEKWKMKSCRSLMKRPVRHAVLGERKCRLEPHEENHVYILIRPIPTKSNFCSSQSHFDQSHLGPTCKRETKMPSRKIEAKALYNVPAHCPVTRILILGRIHTFFGREGLSAHPHINRCFSGQFLSTAVVLCIQSLCLLSSSSLFV